MMNIKVQTMAPGNREGLKGELRLVTTSRGTFLYVNDGNQWYSLSLNSTLTAGTEDRKERQKFQIHTETIVDNDAHDDGGSILPGTGPRNQPGAGAPPGTPR